MTNLKLTNRTQLSVRNAMRFSNVLEMSEEDASRLASLLESDPVFQKLFRTQDPELKVFSRQRFPASRLSTSFYEIPDRAAEPTASPDIEPLVERHKNLVGKIRAIGAEKYEDYFLHEKGDKPQGKIAEELGLSLETVREIQGLTDQVLMNPDFFAAKMASTGAPELKMRYTRLAEYAAKPGGGPEISFLSPGMARGTYKINYDKIRKLKAGGALSEKERKTLQETVRILEMINSRRNLIYSILTRIPKWQREFFESADWDRLKPFAQKSAAQELKVTPAAVCRAIQDRSVLPPNGQETPLADFFPSAKDIIKRKVAGFVRRNKDRTDEEIRKILEKDFGVRLSRRSVNVYRNEILGRKRA